MYRSLMAAGIVFAATMLAKRQFAPVRNDIARYNRMRGMSDDPPLHNQALQMLRDVVRKYAESRRGSANRLLDSIISDAGRYARISRM